MDDEVRTLSRRERLRIQTLREIEDASFAIIDADGVHALSFAALARSMAMSAPAIYRYFPSREALLAHLVALSYQHLATAMTGAVAGSRREPRAKVKMLVAAYREWALGNRRRYGMLFGERAPGLPGDLDDNTALNQAMAVVVDLLVAVGGAAPAETTSGDRTLDAQLRAWARVQQRPETPPRAAAAAILIWTRVHGIVSLELTGIIDGSAVEAQRLIDLEINAAVQSLEPAGP
jgi:AcrR family transcriptional regulator